MEYLQYIVSSFKQLYAHKNFVTWKFSVFTYCHSGHVGVQNNSEESLLEFDSIIVQNVNDILSLFCTPIWPPHHVRENQE